MSDNYELMSGFAIGGMVIGLAIIAIFTILNINSVDIDKVLQYQKDCLVKEFYYMDTHRVLCDKLGVSP